jgi:predicted ATP-grasp superfamily ATP-dependent carboligase
MRQRNGNNSELVSYRSHKRSPSFVFSRGAGIWAPTKQRRADRSLLLRLLFLICANKLKLALHHGVATLEEGGLTRRGAETLAVLIPDGEHDTAFKVLTCLAQVPGTRVHLLSDKAHTRSRYSRYCASFSIVEHGDDGEWFEQVRDAAQQHRIDVMLPVSEPGTRFACVWRERLREFVALPFLPELQTFDIARDKGSLAVFLNDHGLPGPRTVPAARALDADEMTYPALIKPRHSYGGLGIKPCPDRRALENFARANHSELNNYIVQEYVGGYDMGCNALCSGGDIVAYIIHRPLESREQFGRSLHLRLLDCGETLQTSKRLIRAFNWSGIANLDFRHNERRRRIEILEFNPRFWGVLISSLQGGINFPWLCCLSALNRPLPQSQGRLQEYMEVRHAIKAISRKLKGGGGTIPNLMLETNLPFILRDPLPYMNRFIRRSRAYQETDSMSKRAVNG